MDSISLSSFADSFLSTFFEMLISSLILKPHDEDLQEEVVEEEVVEEEEEEEASEEDAAAGLGALFG